MAILIHLIDANPKKESGETHAGLSLLRHNELGWRLKLTAMPSKRELMRSVSDCPLTIAENILLWSKRHKWKIKLHPNSVSLKDLFKECKEYNKLGNPEHIILSCAMLLKNFQSPEKQEQTGLPDFDLILRNMQQEQKQITQQPVQKQQPVQQQQQQPAQKQAVQQPQQPVQQQQAPQEQQFRQYVGHGAEKMRKTQERYQERMAVVNQTLADNAAKEARKEVDGGS